MISARLRAHATLATLLFGTVTSLATAQEPAAADAAAPPAADGTGALPPVDASSTTPAQPPAASPPPGEPPAAAAAPAAPAPAPPAGAAAGEVSPPATRLLGSPGVAFSVERVFGFNAWSYKHDAFKLHGSTLNLLTSQAGTDTGTNPFGTARVGVDAFPIPGLSLGAAVGYFSSGGELEPEGGTDSDLPVTSGFILAPRAGYAAMLNPMFGLWPRAGFTFAQETVEDESGKTTVTMQNLDLELLLVLSPAEHVAVTIGGVFDIGLAGKWKLEPVGGGPDTDDEFTFSNYGATVGLVGYL